VPLTQEVSRPPKQLPIALGVSCSRSLEDQPSVQWRPHRVSELQFAWDYQESGPQGLQYPIKSLLQKLQTTLHIRRPYPRDTLL
jgi:hypothetical protein